MCNKLEYKKINIDDFIKNHNRYRYCEAIIFPDGDISYAVPCHQNALMRAININTQKEIEELWLSIPNDANIVEFLIEKTKCIAIWYQFYAMIECTKEQSQTLNKLIENKLIEPQYNYLDYI